MQGPFCFCWWKCVETKETKSSQTMSELNVVGEKDQVLLDMSNSFSVISFSLN